MIPASIRWRLPLSYAAIALLTTLALGAVLLGILRSTYRQQELDYLTGNAQAISRVVAPLAAPGLPLEALKSQLNSFAFLSQTRIRLLDQAGAVLADSGPLRAEQEVMALTFNVEIEADPTHQTITQTITNEGRGYMPLLVIRKSQASVEAAADFLIGSDEDVTEWVEAETGNEGVRLKKTIAVTGNDARQIEETLRREIGLPESPSFVSALPAVGTPYGFGFSPTAASTDRRSDQQVTQPITDFEGRVIGLIELSEGPAIGDQVLRGVAWGWGLASGVAVLLAGLVGWAISRRISTPLLALTEVTGHMAQGDLSRRAALTGQDEVGRLASSFNEMADQVETTVLALRRFVADAAHELHTPLTALRTNLELATPEAATAEKALFLAQAQAQAHRLERLTNNLLDLSRIEAEAGPATFSRVDLTDLLAQVCEPFASQAEQAGLTFTCQLPAQPLIVAGQALQLQQVFDNLLDNALKFTLPGGTVTVGLRQTSKVIEFWVEDTGIGILAEDQTQLFNRFHRGRNATGYPGSGLGLAIVKAIVERHHGDIGLEQVSPGTKIIVRLPYPGAIG
jgi:signal transduction histidine kinase